MRKRLVRRLDEVERPWSLADDEQPSLLIFGAVPMHLLGEMGDEGARRHGNHVDFVVLVAGCHPPCALNHGDEAVVGMEVRLAEVARLEPVEQQRGPVLVGSPCSTTGLTPASPVGSRHLY